MERPKTSRGKQHPSPEEFTDYVIPSPMNPRYRASHVLSDYIPIHPLATATGGLGEHVGTLSSAEVCVISDDYLWFPHSLLIESCYSWSRTIRLLAICFSFSYSWLISPSSLWYRSWLRYILSLLHSSVFFCPLLCVSNPFSKIPGTIRLRTNPNIVIVSFTLVHDSFFSMSPHNDLPLQ